MVGRRGRADPVRRWSVARINARHRRRRHSEVRIGGGYARYSESKLRADRSANPGQRDTNAGALEFGGGVDVRGFGLLGFRGEVRDIYTGARNFSIPTAAPKVHNIIASGGLVLRF